MMSSAREAWVGCVLVVALSVATGCDCGQTHTLPDAGAADVGLPTIDAALDDAGIDSATDAFVCPTEPGRPVPESLGPCTEARTGEEVCSGSSGSGFACRRGCWRFFWDGPCWPMPDAGPPADAGMCPSPPAIDELGATCSPDGASCPSGYTCQAFSGAVLAHSCQILCELDGCPCPAGTRCVERADKATRWHQCDPVAG